MAGYFVLGIVYAFAAVVQPGPFQAYLISQSLTHGWRRTILASFAPLLSDGPIIILVLLVLNRLTPSLMLALQCAGGLFLIYLSFDAFHAWRHFKEREPVPGREYNLLKAATVNLLNPNPYIGWSLVMGPLLLKGWHESPGWGVMLLVGFYGTMLAGSAAIVVLAGTVKRAGGGLNRHPIGISAVGLAAFGCYQLWSAAMNLHWK